MLSEINIASAVFDKAYLLGRTLDEPLGLIEL